jgi:hypothetical protein
MAELHVTYIHTCNKPLTEEMGGGVDNDMMECKKQISRGGKLPNYLNLIRLWGIC